MSIALVVPLLLILQLLPSWYNGRYLRCILEVTNSNCGNNLSACGGKLRISTHPQTPKWLKPRVLSCPFQDLLFDDMTFIVDNTTSYSRNNCGLLFSRYPCSFWSSLSS